MKIPRSEVLRYLGYGGAEPDEHTNELILRGSAEIQAAASCRSIWRAFQFDEAPDGVTLRGAGGFTLKGQDIRRHLSGCGECVLMAATLGNTVDRRIAAAQVTDMARALVLDCCATAAIEELCDKVQREIEADALARGSGITSRYSPGYGDLPIDCQRDFIALLDAPRRIGLTATAENILIPRKSVTAVIGVVFGPREAGAHESGCGSCNLRDRCPYGRKGCRGGKQHA